MKNLDIELMFMKAWPSLYEENYEGWILRYSKGYTKRANCVNPIVDSSYRFDEKIKYCKEFYHKIGQPVIYKLIDDNFEIDKKLEKLGLEKREEVSVEEYVIDKSIPKVESGHLVWGFSEEWFSFFVQENDINFINASVLREILLKNISNSFYVWEKEEKQVIAGAMAVVYKDSICIFNVYVKEGFRNKSYGKSIIYKILQEAKKKNLKRAYLQVLENNRIAKKLYEKIGFVHKYSSWYRY